MKNCKLNLTKKSCTLGSVEVQAETEMSNYNILIIGTRKSGGVELTAVWRIGQTNIVYIIIK